MNDRIKSWLSEHQTTLVVFLFGQLMVFGTGAVSAFAYMVKLEGRVTTLETRGSSHLAEINNRLTVTEKETGANSARIERMTDIMTRNLNINPK